MACSMMKAVSRGVCATGSLLQQALPAAAAGSQASLLHTSRPAAGTRTMPDRLKDVPEKESPGFFEMVEYYFHKACIIAEDDLIENHMSSSRISTDAKLVRGYRA